VKEVNNKNAKKIINYVVENTKVRWQNYDEYWEKIDEVFLRRGYEQGGFRAGKFAEILRSEGMLSIEKIGLILDNKKDEIGYNRTFAGSFGSPFYRDMESGAYGGEGKKFYNAIKVFRDEKGRAGAWFWNKLWQMLVCCNYLKNNYDASFSSFLKKKYAEFKQLPQIQDPDFLSITPEEWQKFKRSKKPWNELYGIGENVFDFIMGDIKEAKFVAGSYKLDSANLHFLKITGIAGLLHDINRENVTVFLSGLTLPYTLREVNKGIYTYCSETEAINFGFCRKMKKCEECAVNDVCEKIFG
jgi:hypothetical protein